MFGLHTQCLVCTPNVWFAHPMSGLHTQCLVCTPNVWFAHLMLRLHTQCLVCTPNVWFCTPNVWFAKFAHPMFQSILTRISLGELTADLRQCARESRIPRVCKTRFTCSFFSKTWRRETKEMDQVILTEHCL